jgi:hypothetical protein
MFRLARTLSGSTAAWVAALFLAFIPFRFHHLSHLSLIFAGWIPLLFEALVLFSRNRSWRRAIWLGVVFLMNGLTSTSYLILTAIPLAVSASLLLTRYNAWRDSKFWIRVTISLAIASLLLLPFLLPFRQVAKLNNFVRSPAEVQAYSAKPINWLAAEPRNILWRGFGASGVNTEMVLFPGIMGLLLAVAALLITKPKRTIGESQSNPSRGVRLLLICLDITAVISAVLAFLATGYDVFKLRMFGSTLATLQDPSVCLLILTIAIIVRCTILYPQILRNVLHGERNLRETIKAPDRSEAIAHGLVWFLIGFAGSFGLNFFFHRVLYDFVPGFQSMRVATRWAMIAYVGLALLAGTGAVKFVSLFEGLGRTRLKKIIYALILLAILVELRVVPLKLVRGPADPDQLTLFLKSQKMAGGIVELPAGSHNHLYMLRAADHLHPLVNATDSFVSPLALRVEELTSNYPIPDSFLDLLEQVPVSYVTVRNGFLSSPSRLAIESWIQRGIYSGRLRFIGSFDAATIEGREATNDLYAVTKTEPNSRQQSAELPVFLKPSLKFVGLPENFETSGFTVYRFYRAAYGRRPKFAEFTVDLEKVAQEGKNTFAASWANRDEFTSKFQSMDDEQFVTSLLSNADLPPTHSSKVRLIGALREKTMTRAEALLAVVEEPMFVAQEFDGAFVLMQYFAYLHRDPEEDGFKFWLEKLRQSGNYQSVNDAFAKAEDK